MAKEITFTYAKGKTTIAAAGFTGNECKAETAEVEELLGTVESTTRTAEANRQTVKAGAPKVQR